MAGKPVSKVEDVCEGIKSFGELAVFMTGGHPILMIMAAQWMATLVHKLVEWGAITREESFQVMALIQAHQEEVEAEMKKPADEELIWTVGI